MADLQFGPLVARPGPVWRVIIDNPPLNLVNGAFIVGLRDLCDALDAHDPAVIVFTSADPDFFLMHGDVESILGAPHRDYAPVTEPNMAAATFARLACHRTISIGAIDGAARGGGAEFLAALDLRIATTRAVLGQPEVPMGILPGAGGTSRLPHLLGRGRALEVILTGRDVAAEEALAIGWVDAVVAPAELEPTVAALAARIAAMPRESVAAAKRVVDVSLTEGIDRALVAETDAYALLTARQQHRAPMERFLALGGQTREGETTRMAEIVDAMVERGTAS